MSIDIATATLDELQSEYVRLAGVVADASDQRNAVLQTMDARKAAVSAKFDLDSATDLEKDTLRALLEVDAAKVDVVVMKVAQSVSSTT